MKNLKLKNILVLIPIILLCMAIPVEAWADDGNIFSTIRARVVKALVDSHQLVYLLAGFGLIGFAFMAIFNKISWKWFANIAIGLFLVAVMGMIISYFTGDDSIAEDLDFGYDMGTQTSNPGSAGEIGETDCSKHPDQCPGYTPPLNPNGGPSSRL